MSQHRASRSIVLGSLLAFMVPLLAAAAPAEGDPCKQMHRALDRQIDDKKAQQEDELQECQENNGRESDACVSLKNEQKQYLQSLRANRRGRLAACNGSSALDLSTTATPFVGTPYFQNRGNCVEYPYTNCQQRKQHYIHVKRHHHHPPATGSGAADKASAKSSSPRGQGSERKPRKDTSAGKNSSAGSSSSSRRSDNSGSGSYSGASRSADNSSSHAGYSYSGSSGQSASSSPSHVSSGSSSSPSPSRDSGSTRPK